MNQFLIVAGIGAAVLGLGVLAFAAGALIPTNKSDKAISVSKRDSAASYNLKNQDYIRSIHAHNKFAL